jgi:hypothetical protein
MTIVANRCGRTRHQLWARALLTSAVVLAAAGVGAQSAAAVTICDSSGDVCVVSLDTVQTPVGVVTVTTSPTHIVTVHLDPISSGTWVIGIPFAIPPGPPVSGCPGGCTRRSVDTTSGLVTIDTITPPQGPSNRASLPSVAIISIHPPSPCRVRTVGTTITFTPVTPGIPPGPPA